MIKFIKAFCFICLLSAVSIAFSQEFKREKYNFNADWKLKTGDLKGAEKNNFNDNKWERITLPHAYNQNEAFKKDIENLTTGIVWYRKNFKLPQGISNKKVFLEFEGIRHAGEIYINGAKIGLHENGVMAFGLDISNYVKPFPFQNVVALRIDNDWKYREQSSNATYQWNDKNFNANYGGIPKNVFLHITDKLYQTLPLYSNLETTGTYIYASQINIANKSAVINAESQLKNEFSVSKTVTYQVELFDLDNKKIAEFSGNKTTIAPGETKTVKASQVINDLHFWSWGYGYLYTAKTILIVDGKEVDAVATKTGFRKTEFNNGEIVLNDRVIQMKGYAQRTSNEWPALGMSVPAWMSDFSNQLMVESNANLVRWMHVTPWKQDVESCDRVGLMQAMPAGDAEKDAKGNQWIQRVNLMRDAIIYNRNNPSIVFYECGNESISEVHMQEMKNLKDTYDPHGGRAIGSREMLDSNVAEYGGEMLYINKSARKPMWATEYSRDEGMRKYWDEYSPPFHKEGDGPLYRDKDASDYNHNQDRHAIEDVIRWNDYFVERPGTGKRVNSGGVNIIFSDSNTHHRGESNYRTSGEVDPMRIPKDGFFAHQVMWDGWVDIEKQRTHILGHWNYSDATIKNEYVVSSGEKVELFVNGKSKGFGKRSNTFLFTFENIPFEAGTLKAVSYDAQGKNLSEDKKITAGTPFAIKLTPHTNPNGFGADGSDVALVDVEVVDKNGQRCPTNNAMIHFTLTGNATWLGGIAQGPDNYILSKDLPVENGVNRIMIQSTPQSGAISISAQSNDLQLATITFNTRAVSVENGLSKQLPGKDLPSNLQRGPTPETASYSIKRTPVFISHATALANNDDAYKSYDDNELTEWTNDGKVSTGRIVYTLSAPSQINQCVVKFTGWRTKSYPIRILADGKEVFKGNTSQSLGYITLDLIPILAKEITIELTGINTEKDGFDKIVEVDPTKELDLYKDKMAAEAKGQLRIVEIEFYKKQDEE
ncbi:glycoside hydrolase family 2 protein [Flavobacterium cellulosilyticum]|uniref:Glycoside hydrolase family 2 protein n=1 Tax=Flavobacterium cellulosilyticum TaxID=2541731 RepID=A0A4R5CAL0_9FLAO|nr:sugar-binding domain-containing protein [Flavobacterium cellulosilyticum]TDD95746.1 glycoside hydrolase family 2 protein [Flavobacterium cellulosilyticum]